MNLKTDFERLNILIIEDNPGDVRLVRELVAEIPGAPVHIEAVPRLADACERLSRGGIDIVLLDLLLPDSEGLDTLRRVKECAPRLPIVVLTVLKDVELAVQAISLGAQDYLFKGEMDSALLARGLKYSLKRNELEIALLESEERFRLAADNYPSAFVIYDSERRVEYINETGLRLLNRPREEVIGKKDEEFIQPEILQKFKPALDKAVETLTTQTIELPFLFHEETYTYIITYVPVLDEHHKLKQIVAFTHDITDRKAAEESLRQSETRYRELSENLERTVKTKVEQLRRMQTLAQIGQMVSVVAHEIRNPLQNIRMGVDSIRAVTRNDPEKFAILDEIDHGVNLLNNTVSELLEYSKPMELQKSPWPVREICDQAVRGLSHLLGAISVKTACRPESLSVSLDGPKIIRLLMNLITNSVEAMPKGGTIEIISEILSDNGGRKLRITVSDTGPGIPPEQIPLVQEPFFTTKLHGTGLGLGICRKIAEAHDGTLSIASQVGKGTTVEVNIPIETFD